MRRRHPIEILRRPKPPRTRSARQARRRRCRFVLRLAHRRLSGLGAPQSVRAAASFERRGRTAHREREYRELSGAPRLFGVCIPRDDRPTASEAVFLLKLPHPAAVRFETLLESALHAATRPRHASAARCRSIRFEAGTSPSGRLPFRRLRLFLCLWVGVLMSIAWERAVRCEVSIASSSGVLSCSSWCSLFFEQTPSTLR